MKTEPFAILHFIDSQWLYLQVSLPDVVYQVSPA